MVAFRVYKKVVYVSSWSVYAARRVYCTCPFRLGRKRSAPCKTSELSRGRVVVVPPAPNSDTNFPRARCSGERDLKALDSGKGIYQCPLNPSASQAAIAGADTRDKDLGICLKS